MNWSSKRMWQVFLLSFAAFPAFGLSTRMRHTSIRPLAANIIVPQSRAFHVAAQPQVRVTEVKVGVVILEQVATTTMDVSLQNPSGRRLEAELLVPVPEGAALKGFTFHGTAEEPTAEILPKEEAKR